MSTNATHPPPLSPSRDEIAKDVSPLFILYKDGRIEKPEYHSDVVPPSTDQETGVQSKDIVTSQLSARLYLPKNATPSKKLPLLVYYHGGGFAVQSAFHPSYHSHLNYIVSESNVVAVSVNYRLAPENPLPACYEDSWLALSWISQNYNKEEWLKNYADMDRVYIGGDSAGANIAHNMGIRFGSEKLDGINLRGIFLNCPFFWGKDPIGSEVEFYKKPATHYPHELWQLVCPTSSGCDDPLINPGKDPKLGSLGCKKMLVFVAGLDFLRERGWYYKEALEKSGWDGQVEVIQVEDEGHCFSVGSPKSENGFALIIKVAAFLNQY